MDNTWRAVGREVDPKTTTLSDTTVMAKITPNPLLLQAISGAIGNLVFYQDANGNLIVRPKTEREAPLSEAQLGQIDKFKLAAVYGKQVQNDPVLSVGYRPLCGPRQGPYHVALRDFLCPPVVAGIDLQSFTGQPDQLIGVVATDDAVVVAVQVIIRHAASNVVLEQGSAGLSAVADRWLYVTTTVISSGTPIVVEATAMDRPGNQGTAKVHHFVP